jgi:hypothetical protein
MSRTPDIMADAAYLVFQKPAKSFTGNFLIDDTFLAGEGLADLFADDKDRRSRRVRLTPAGRALAERVVAAVQASGEEFFSRALSKAEMARLAGLLRKLLLAVEP